MFYSVSPGRLSGRDFLGGEMSNMQKYADLKRERGELHDALYNARMIAQENVLKLTKSSRELGYHGYLKIIEECDKALKECE